MLTGVWLRLVAAAARKRFVYSGCIVRRRRRQPLAHGYFVVFFMLFVYLPV
jgi:hypothetical protein